jgi:2-methylcitrate dehydratase PrpD
MYHAQALARFVSGLDPGRVPESAVEATKRAVLDFIGVAAFGSATPWAAAGRHYVENEGCSGSSVVVGPPWQISPRDAALLNGLYAHGFELDDTHVPSSSHPGSTVIPAALAAMAASRVHGSRFLLAVIAGYEIMGRIGFAAAPEHIVRGFHPTGTVGVFGAAAAASVMLQLNEERTLAALALAGSFASGLMEFANDAWGDMAKRLHAGRAAESGLAAARLAASGYRGPRSVLEGPQGFLRCFATDAHVERLTAGLGLGYEIENNLLFKPYACCSNIFAVIDALRGLIEEHGLRPEDVRRAIVNGNIDQVQYHAASEVSTVMGAQYSVPYVAAVTLEGLIDEPAVAFAEQTIRSERIGALCRRVEVRLDPQIDALFPGLEAARVVVQTRRGAEFERTVEHPKGSPENPMSGPELDRKFRTLTKTVFASEIAERVRETAMRLDTAEMSELVTLLGSTAASSSA